LNLRGNAHAGVCDGKAEVITGLDPESVHVSAFIDADRCQTDVQGAAGGFHGMESVGAQVHHHLMEEGRVNAHRPGLGFDMSFDGNGRGQGGTEQFHCLLDDESGIEDYRLGVGLAAEGQDLFDQVLGPVAGLEDLIQIPGHHTSFGNTVPGHVRIADDRPEDVVEVMSDAAGQGADGLQFLGLKELGLEVFIFRFGLLTLSDVGVGCKRRENGSR
jgi:hypothetical protein